MKHLMAAVAILALSAFPAMAADTRVQCDFYSLERAQAAARTQGPALLGQVTTAMTPVALDAVYVFDNAIRRKVMAQDLFARRTPNNSVELIARLVNCTDFPLQVQGRTSFLDAQQIPTENKSAWQTIFIQPRSFATYREVSIGANVAYYMIELKGNQ